MTAIRTSGRSAAHFDFAQFERQHEQLKSERIGEERVWRDLGDYVDTGNDVDPIARGGSQLPRNRVDGTAQLAADRCGAVLNGYLFSPFSPFFKGRIADRDMRHHERDWLAKVDRIMHNMLTGPRAPFRLSMGTALYSAAVYGSAPLFITRRNRLLISASVSIWDAWLAENAETQLVDTMHRRFRLPAWRAALRWPRSQALAEKAEKQPQAQLVFVQAIDPNPQGLAGSRKTAKPWLETIVWLDGKEVLAHDGYDEFPGAAMRFKRRSNTAYGTGPGRASLSWAKLINAREDNALQAEEQNLNPALLDYTNGAVDPNDRRPGARIPVDGNSMLFRNGKPFERLFDEIKLHDSHARVEKLRELIEKAFFVDWMSPGEGERVTATFVNDRRDLRMRAMASVVASMEFDFNQIGERFFNLMDRMGLFPEPPESLHGAEIIFEFVSPLAMAQQQGEVERLMAWLEVCAQAVAFDPSAGRVVDAPELAREAARQYGVPEPVVRSVETVRAEQKAMEDEEDRAADAAFAESAATVLRDAGQGAAALIGAGGPRQV